MLRGFDRQHWLGALQQQLLRHTAEQQLADRVAMPDADHQKVSVGAVHRREQLVSGVDADRLGQLELHPAVRQLLLDIVDLARLGESRIRIGLP